MDGSDNRIGEVRTRKGLKQVDLAHRLELSRGQLANMESGTRKVDLPQLRQIAAALDCSVIDLLLPADAPNHPSEAEADLLAELRALDGYDARAILTAARAVIEAARSVQAVQAAPKNLAGDPQLAREMALRWSDLDDGGRQKALNLLDTAREFSTR